MKESETKSSANSGRAEKLKVSAAPKGPRLAMRVAGLPPYRKRLKAYMTGDRTSLVSPAFKDAVDSVGKRPVHLHQLSGDEKKALTGLDLRWKKSPDGALLWAPSPQTNIDPRNSPDFAWLLGEAQAVFAKNLASNKGVDAGQAPLFPQWIFAWAQSWSDWCHRFASAQYDQALSAAVAKKVHRPATSSSLAVSNLSAVLRVFLLEYLPQSGLTDAVRGAQKSAQSCWILPEELLNASFHSHADEFRDDFWNRCCAGLKRIRAQNSKEVNHVGSNRSHVTQSFLDFVVSKLNGQKGTESQFRNPFLPRTPFDSLMVRATVQTVLQTSTDSPESAGGQLEKIRYVPPVARDSDKSCSWISRDYPQLRAWEPFAREYIQETKKGMSVALVGLSLFIERYLANAGKPGTPGEKLDPECAKRPIPDNTSADALLIRGNKDRVPRTLVELSDATGRAPLRSIRDGLIPHILRQHCSLIDGDHTSLLPEFYNPFANVELDDKPGSTNIETGREAMPYRWIRRLRNIIVKGPHFCDWTWALQAQKSELGSSADWFEVDESLIDRGDPDCVWRKRTIGSKENYDERTLYEMLSPVRWVALVIKLNTALRTMQVRVLDSGESDGLRFDLRQWAEQTYSGGTPASISATPVPAVEREMAPGGSGSPWVLNDIERRNADLYASIKSENMIRAKGKRGDPLGWNNGVLRPYWALGEDSGQKRLTTVLYINTNKTADAKKEGAAKGFDVPLPIQSCPLSSGNAYWIRQGEGMPPMQRNFATERQKQDWLDELGENTHWWLAKLRDWQEKYNPVSHRVQWKELSGTRLMSEKSDEQYEMYRPACFLFREPAMTRSKNHPGPAYPVPDSVIAGAWWSLLKELQGQLNAERTEGQAECRLVKDDTGYVKSCVYDLHSIRVSIITALIVEGKVPVQYVQRLVGHSRIVMTIYYTKINPLTMMREISCGFTRATESEIEREKESVQNATAAELRANSAFNDADSALAALGIDRPAGKRNVLMWMRKLGGICPVGGVTHDTEGGLRAGCFNGGKLISGSPGDKKAKYAAVEGGPATCVNCRWFFTRMPFIGELQAIGENALYRYHEFKDKTTWQEQQIGSIRDEFSRIEVEQGSLTDSQHKQFNRDLDAAEAIRDGFMESAALDVMISGNAFNLIQRLIDNIKQSSADQEGALVANGTQDEVQLILAQTDSAMLHAARISLHSELHPEINAPAATLRAAMVIARKLQEESLNPFALLSLPEEVQTRAVNAVTRHIAMLCDPQNLNIGLSKAAALLESRHKLSEITGTSPLKLSEWLTNLADDHTSMPAVTSTSLVDPLLN